MKHIGFIQEHDHMEISSPFESYLGSSPLEHQVRNSIIDYLNHGVIVLAWMGHFEDIRSGASIAPFSYYTDGEWIWPSYFAFYLSEIPEFEVAQPFLDYLAVRDYIWKDVAIEEQHFSKIKADFMKRVMN